MKVLCAVIVALCGTVALADSNPQSIFSADDVADCTRIRTPELVKSGQDDSGISHWHVFATCCGENACGHKTRRRLGDNSGEPAHNATLGDDHTEARIIYATSTDKGLTWGKSQFLAGGKKGLEGVNAIFDKVTGHLVVQYQSGESLDSKKTYQTKSFDHGTSWKTTVELTDQLKGCEVGETAGPRVQTASGRLLWYSGKGSCVWYSDDHGATYKTHAAQVPHVRDGGKFHLLKNEVSFSVVDEGNSSYIFASGRSIYPDWQPYRINYVSKDDGITWEASKSALKDPMQPKSAGGHVNTEERALLYAGGKLWTAEPKGTEDGSLRQLILSCSSDGGKTWPKSTNINGAHYAGYSNLGWLNHGKNQKNELLVVWDHEKDDAHTVGAAPLSQVVNTDNFCM